jgi:hypothetical protein
MTDNQLNRLLRAAAKESTASASPAGTPFGFETRVIAHWLCEPHGQSCEPHGQSQPDWRFEDSTMALIRRALAFACALAVVSLVLSYQTLVSSPSPELAIANNALEIDSTP